MKLLNLKLENFKGVRNLEISFENGGNLAIHGDNATGKTTVADSFNWLLFGKDSRGREKFNVKTLDSNGVPLHHLEHSVEAVLDVNGDEVQLKRLYKEKWTKKRGSATASFSGHTVDFYINGVPKKEKEFSAYIGAIIDENMFRLITNPAYFNEVLKWDERRKLLIETFGDIDEKEVLADNKYQVLVNAIGKNSVEEYNKVITAEKRRINKVLDENSVRIDEQSKNLLTFENVESIVADLKAKSETAYSEINSLRNKEYNLKQDGGQAELEADLLAKEKELKRLIEDSLKDKNSRLNKIESQKKATENELANANKVIDELIDINKTLEHNKGVEEKRIEALKEEFKALPSFEYEDVENCPACGQPLPTDKVAEARAKAEEIYKLNRSKAVEEINERGCRARKEADLIDEKIKGNKTKLNFFKGQVIELEDKVENLSKKIEKIESEPSYESSEMYIKLNQEITDLKSKLSEPDKALEDSLNDIKTQIDNKQTKADTYAKQLLEIEVNQKNIERVEALNEEQKTLSSRYEELETLALLMEEFTRDKVSKLEEKISANFKYARFKMYDEQVNGGYKENCEVTFNNVPYSDLNNASRINVGLDIINTFSKQAGITAPIFVDNAEAITKFIDTESQLIKLVVDENYKALEIKKGA